MNIINHVIFLLDMLTGTKMNLFYEYEYKNKIKLF